MKKRHKRIAACGLLLFAVAFMACVILYILSNLKAPTDQIVTDLFEQVHPDTTVKEVEYSQDGIRFAGFTVTYTKDGASALFKRDVYFRRTDKWRVHQESKETEIPPGRANTSLHGSTESRARASSSAP